MEYEELMKGFAERTGLQDLTVSDGSAAVEIDGHKVAFIHDDAAATVTIYGEIGFPPPDANGSFGEVMLKANHLFNGTDGAVLCQNPDTFAFALFRPLRLIDMDVETFCDAVGKLVDQVEGWKRVLQGFREAEEAAQDVADEEETLKSLSPVDGFLRV